MHNLGISRYYAHRKSDVGVVPVIVTEDVDAPQGSSKRRGSLDSGSSSSMQGPPPVPIGGNSGPSSLGLMPQSRPRAGTWSIPGGYKKRHNSSSNTIQNRGSEAEVVKSPVVNRRHQFATAFSEAFRPRSKSDATREKPIKKPSLISSMKQSIQSTLSQPSSSGHRSTSGGNLTPHWSSVDGDDSSRPRSGSDGHYANMIPASGRGVPAGVVNRNPYGALASQTHHYATVHQYGGYSSQTSSSYRSPVSKMFDSMFNRNRSNSVATSAAAEVEPNKRRVIPQKSVPPTFLTAAARRHSAFPASERRGSLGSVDDRHTAILFRDARGLPHADPFVEKTELENLEGDESQIYVKFFRFHKCYDLIPTSAKLVVFDTQLQVKKAFYALVYNGVRAAPLWDSDKQKFCGMLTITDFIRILQKYYKSPGKHISELEDHKLDSWRKDLAQVNFAPLVSISPEASLFDAIQRLVQYRIHRLPVIDPTTGDVLYIVTHKRIFRFLCLYLHELPRPSYLDRTLEELNIGSYTDVAVAHETTPIIEALKLFIDRRVSALPVLDDAGKLKNIYAKFDVINLAAAKTYDNLDMSLKEANAHRHDWFEGVQKCCKTDTLGNVMEKIAKAEVHRLVVVDKDEHVVGVVSLSDILKYLVLDPAAKCEENRRKNSECLDEDAGTLKESDSVSSDINVAAARVAAAASSSTTNEKPSLSPKSSASSSSSSSSSPPTTPGTSVAGPPNHQHHFGVKQQPPATSRFTTTAVTTSNGSPPNLQQQVKQQPSGQQDGFGEDGIGTHGSPKREIAVGNGD